MNDVKFEKIKGSVCAVIVTYNRSTYLMNLLRALEKQTRKLDGIFIFDNCSNDDTADKLIENKYCGAIVSENISITDKEGKKVYYYRNRENSGGAGGFYRAIHLAVEIGFHFLWIMDDDVLPKEDCLEKMISFQSDSCMICLPNRTGNGFQDYAIVNVDMINPFTRSIDKWKTRINPEDMKSLAIEVKDMTFEGPLINVELVKKIGLPNKELFILFDDSEYAMRAINYTKILFIKEAVLLKQIIPNGNTPGAEWKVYYNFRNAVWFNKKYGHNILTRNVRPIILCTYWAIKYLLKGHKKCAYLVVKGYQDGIAFRLGKMLEPK